MSGESVKSVQLLRHHSSSHHNGQHNSIRKLRRNVLTEIRRKNSTNFFMKSLKFKILVPLIAAKWLLFFTAKPYLSVHE